MFGTLNSENRLFCEKIIIKWNAKILFDIGNILQEILFSQKFSCIKLGMIFSKHMIWYHLQVYLHNLKISSPLLWGWKRQYMRFQLLSFFLYFGFCIYYLASVEWLQAIKNREKSLSTLLILAHSQFQTQNVPLPNYQKSRGVNQSSLFK